MAYYITIQPFISQVRR